MEQFKNESLVGTHKDFSIFIRVLSILAARAMRVNFLCCRSNTETIISKQDFVQ